MQPLHDQAIPVAHVQDELDSIIGSASDVVVRVVETLLLQSVYNRGSDIHFESVGDELRVRCRIDGTFRLLGELGEGLREQVISRLKVLANLQPHRRDIPQEGRMTLALEEDTLDLRLSVIPTIHGEKAVVRIFDPRKAFHVLEELGLDRATLQDLDRMLQDMRGMIVVTGPSSAGKTTTLYTCLRRIHEQRSDFACIVSIEDPVEYDLGFVAQMEVNRRLDLDFARSLRAILRQDPEVIMVGEIRDLETCQIALRAGLTGHCVLTTIHSGNTTEVLTRLLDMGVEPFVVASAVTGAMAQRLVRRVCQECREPYTPARQLLDSLAGADLEGVEFLRGRGCSSCGETGYLGRTLIAELMVMDDRFRAAIVEKASSSSLRSILRESERPTLLEDGLRKVRDGITTVEEVVRVLGTTSREMRGT
jgi:type IV pilus assembly protein PilB